MDYKRLTRKNKDGTTWVKCAVCDSQDKCDFTKETCCQELQDRLAEIEDKIEQGTLIEIPTKEFVFHISKSKNGNYVVREISKYYYMSVYACTDDIMNKWFSTREEAEKKLKELQNG